MVIIAKQHGFFQNLYALLEYPRLSRPREGRAVGLLFCCAVVQLTKQLVRKREEICNQVFPSFALGFCPIFDVTTDSLHPTHLPLSEPQLLPCTSLYYKWKLSKHNVGFPVRYVHWCLVHFLGLVRSRRRTYMPHSLYHV